MRDDLTNQELLEKVQDFAERVVWNALHGNMKQAKRWSDDLLCGRWCAEQRGIGKDEIRKHMLAGADLAVNRLRIMEVL